MFLKKQMLIILMATTPIYSFAAEHLAVSVLCLGNLAVLNELRSIQQAERINPVLKNNPAHQQEKKLFACATALSFGFLLYTIQRGL